MSVGYDFTDLARGVLLSTRKIVTNSVFRFTVFALEVVGSSLGVLKVAQVIASNSFIGIGWFAVVFFCVVYVFGFVAAWQTARNTQDFIDWNLVFWSLQTPILVTRVVSYQCFSAIFAFVSINPRAARMTLGGALGSDFLFSLGPHELEPRIGLNLVAIAFVLLFALGRHWNSQEE